MTTCWPTEDPTQSCANCNWLTGTPSYNVSCHKGIIEIQANKHINLLFLSREFFRKCYVSKVTPSCWMNIHSFSWPAYYWCSKCLNTLRLSRFVNRCHSKRNSLPQSALGGLSTKSRNSNFDTLPIKTKLINYTLPNKRRLRTRIKETSHNF